MAAPLAAKEAKDRLNHGIWRIENKHPLITKSLRTGLNVFAFTAFLEAKANLSVN
jgi:hypothetical protein